MKWTVWFKRRGWEKQMEAEFRFHLESRRNDYIREGLSPKEAELRARREFGAVELAKDECRDERPAAWLDHLLRDFRYTLRSLRKSAGFAFAAIGTLALGIGANTAIFQLIDAVRLRALPVANPQALATLELADRKGWRGSQATEYPALTNPQWERFRDTQQAFSAVFAWGDNGFGVSLGGESHPARGLFVSGDYFRVLGVQPLIGRVFTAADDHRGCGLPGAVISYAFWQRELGGEPSAIGRKLTLNFQPVEIIGVTPASFSGLEIGSSYDVAVPICSQAVLWNEGNWLDEGTVWWLNVVGRLRPGETLERANAQLRVTSPAVFQATLPSNYPAVNVKDYLNFKLRAVPAGTGVSGLRARYGDPLLLLLATSGLVLLIACANLANLILARATTREHEFAVRLAIGASRSRLIRQLMVESILLALAGATAGVLLSGFLSKFLVSLLGTPGDPLFLDLQPDGRILAFAAGLASLTCILFGLTPALRATRIAPADAMKTAGRALSANRERFELRQALVVSQVALSLVLLVGALLFSGSLRNLLAVDAGFQHTGIVITNLDFSRLKIPSGARMAFKHDLLQKIRSLPGVASAAVIGILPLSGGSTSNLIWKEGSNPDTKLESRFNWLGEGCLKTMAIPLLAGRDFSDRDTVSSPRVAIVNQSLARRLGLGPNPVGTKLVREATPSEPEQVFEIVGLVRDTKYYTLREEFLPIVFLSSDQDTKPGPFSTILVRSTLPLTGITSGVRRAIAQVSPTIDIDFESFETRVREGLLRERLMATLSGFFGLLASLISAVGLYGVMSFLVVRRTGEIGIRIALGAGRASIAALIVRQASVLLAIGVAVGILLTLAIAGAANSILFGLKPYDFGTLALATALLTAVTAAASFLPARRAARLEPMVALREE
jgi:putative ABC transport system permease protein